MKIVIATGIYPPDIGGPAYYAKGLEGALRELGVKKVDVVVYGDLRHAPMGLSHLRYFLRIWPRLRDAGVVIALDTASVALPAYLAARLRGVKFIIRTGGDFVWERYLERTHELIPLPQFYEAPRRLSLKERLVLSLTRFVARRSVMVFSTEMQRDVWLRPYRIEKGKTRIIGNAVDEPLSSELPQRKNFLWYARDTALKNGRHLHAAFAKAKQQYPDIILEEGQVPKDELLRRMRSCYAVVLPSVTEISPNYILDALRFHKPFIMDKYSGLAQWLAPYGTIVDPLSEESIAAAIARLASTDGYKDALEKASRFSFTRTYREVARDFLDLIAAL